MTELSVSELVDEWDSRNRQIAHTIVESLCLVQSIVGEILCIGSSIAFRVWSQEHGIFEFSEIVFFGVITADILLRLIMAIEITIYGFVVTIRFTEEPNLLVTLVL